MNQGLPPGMNRPSPQQQQQSSMMLGSTGGSVPSPMQHQNQHLASMMMSPMPGPGQSSGGPMMMSSVMGQSSQQQQQQQQSMISNQLHGPTSMAPQQMPSHQPPPQQQPPVSVPQMSKQQMCRYSADFVQEIVSKALELFQQLRSLPQFHAPNQQYEDKKNKIKETTKYIETLFKRLRKFYEACSDLSIDYVDPKTLIPLKDDDSDDERDERMNDDNEKSLDNGGETTTLDAIHCPSASYIMINDEKRKNNPRLQQLEKEYNDLVELNMLKNRQMKEIIDKLRKMIWDINTMLAMRKP